MKALMAYSIQLLSKPVLKATALQDLLSYYLSSLILSYWECTYDSKMFRLAKNKILSIMAFPGRNRLHRCPIQPTLPKPRRAGHRVLCLIDHSAAIQALKRLKNGGKLFAFKVGVEINSTANE